MKRFVLLLLIFNAHFFKTSCLVINQGGIYVLGQDIAEAGTVISIEASDVILDMGGKTVSGGTTGIAVASSISNVTIKNGFVDGSTTGIAVDTSVSSLFIENVAITGCTNRAISIVGSVGNEVTKVYVTNLTISDCCTGVGADYACNLELINDFIWSNVVVETSGSASISFRAFNIQTCTRGTLNNVLVQNNTAGTTLIGVRIENTSDSYFNNVQVRSNSATGELYGFSFAGSGSFEGNFSQDCLVSSNVAGDGPLYAYDITVNALRNVWLRCVANDNVLTNAVATANARGFNLDQISFCNLIECRASNNRVSADGTTNTAVGFYIGSTGGGTTGVKNCELFNNIAVSNNGPVDARSYGFQATSASGGNTNNAYIFNMGMRNGPTTPVSTNQITTSTGGVPAGSVQAFNTTSLAFNVLYSNLRVI